MKKKVQKTKKTKKKSLTKLKKELDKEFSIYIRKKYAVDGMVTCYTCGAKKPIKKMQCGHFMSREYLSLRRDEANCRPQCYRCNIKKNGNYIEFFLRMIREHGLDFVEKLALRAKEKVKLTPEMLQEKIEYYKKLNASK